MTLAQLYRQAARLGVTVDAGGAGRAYEVVADSPCGIRFKANGCHSLVESVFTNPEAARKEMSARLAMGVEQCDSDCWCQEER